eukprot:EC715392.1.p2 GENE.EC715392.1~~EC715392.1.p2  ORF type:complete len:92 (+),score=4.16 EC715392.1:155-430(+)
MGQPLFYWGSIALYFALLVPFSMWLSFDPPMYGIMQEIGSQPRFWVCIVVETLWAVFPEWVFKAVRVHLYPQSWHITLERDRRASGRELEH